MVLFVALFLAPMASSIAFTASLMAFMVSQAAAFLVCLVSLGTVVWVTVSEVSLFSLVFPVVVFAAFLATAAGSLASLIPRVFSDLEVSSLSVVLFLTAMVGSLTSWGSQVHQVTPGTRESGRGHPLAGHLQLCPSTPPP